MKKTPGILICSSVRKFPLLLPTFYSVLKYPVFCVLSHHQLYWVFESASSWSLSGVKFQLFPVFLLYSLFHSELVVHAYYMQGKVRVPYLSHLIDALLNSQFYVDLPTISTWIASVIFCVSQFTLCIQFFLLIEIDK